MGPDDEWKLSDLFLNWHRLAKLEHLVTPISPLAVQLITFHPEGRQAAQSLIEIIESDPILTARVLGLANAAVFAGAGKPIFEIKSAVMRLGMDVALRVALAQLAAVWMRRSTAMPDRTIVRGLWREYLTTAYCSVEIAKVTGLAGDTPGLVYAAGLLHDLGTIGLINAAPEAMMRFIRAGYCLGTRLHDEFVEAHVHLGEALLLKCGAPSVLAEVALLHHAGMGPDAMPVPRVVEVADHLHHAILSHVRNPTQFIADMPLGCFDAPALKVGEGVEALGIGLELDEILGRVAVESERIEALAGDFV